MPHRILWYRSPMAEPNKSRAKAEIKSDGGMSAEAEDGGAAAVSLDDAFAAGLSAVAISKEGQAHAQVPVHLESEVERLRERIGDLKESLVSSIDACLLAIKQNAEELSKAKATIDEIWAENAVEQLRSKAIPDVVKSILVDVVKLGVPAIVALLLPKGP